jgi:hypothetical protein
MVPYFMVGFGLIVAGLIVAGPWLTMVVNKLVARYASGASVLLASRRLADNPKAAFRPVSVMVVALFLCTMIAAVAPVFLQDAEYQQKDAGNIFAATQYLASSGQSISSDAAYGLKDSFETVPGVKVTPILVPANQTVQGGISNVLIRCADAARLKIFGHCKPGATALQEQSGFEFNDVISSSLIQTPVSMHTSDAVLQSLSVYSFIIMTDGRSAHIERLRTLIGQHLQYFSTGQTWNEIAAARLKLLSSIQLVIYGGLVLILFVAGCSLAVASAGGLIERKRPFGLLCASGMSLGQLVWAVLYESAAPLLAAALLAMGTALFVVRMLLLSFGDRPVSMPSLTGDYYVLIGSGLAVALLMLLTTLPILAAITRPTQVRFE